MKKTMHTFPERLKDLRDRLGYTQSDLAKKLSITRASVNAWEMGLSTPTTQYVAAMAQLFHVSSDYMLGIENRIQITLDGYSQEETKLIFNLLKYFDEHR